MRWAGAFHLAPGLLLKFLVWALQVSDYFGCLPGSITHLSHFHGSLYITFMASLGIPPIFHRLYDFGNVPVFWSFGRKRQAFEYQWDGTVAGGGRLTAASSRTSGLWTDSISRSPCTVFRI